MHIVIGLVSKQMLFPSLKLDMWHRMSLIFFLEPEHAFKPCVTEQRGADRFLGEKFQGNTAIQGNLKKLIATKEWD